jgi:hypothetical protein
VADNVDFDTVGQAAALCTALVRRLATPGTVPSVARERV